MYSAVWRLAIKDLLRQWKLLSFSICSFAIGISAIVSLSSLVQMIKQGLDDQSRTLLGADLNASSKLPFADEVLSVVQREPNSRIAREISFTSMFSVPGQAGTRLVQLRALEAGYPFYGEVETDPPQAFAQFSSPTNVAASAPNGESIVFPAIIDSVLASQFSLKPGSRFKIGRADFVVTAELKKFPGENIARALFAPRVLVPYLAAAATELIGFGSRVSYRLNIAIAETQARERVQQALQSLSEEHSLRIDTVALRQAELGSTVDRVYRYLGLLGFLALALGAVGIAVTVQIVTDEKRPIVATLRCLGMTGGEVVVMVLVQSLCIGITAALLGLAFSQGLAIALESSLRDIVPIAFETGNNLQSVALGFAAGAVFSLAFAAIPARNLLAVSPAAAFRDERSENQLSKLMLGGSCALLGIAGFFCGWWFLQSALYALLAVSGFFIILGVFVIGAKCLTVVLRLCLHWRMSFIFRHGLAKLARQGGKSLMVVSAVGLGCFLLTILSLLRESLLAEVRFSGSAGRPNVILFDIQDDQRELVKTVANNNGFAIEQTVPIVAMNLHALRGRGAAELRADKQENIPDWTLRREYRATYRATLSDSEQIVAGEWQGSLQSPVSESRRVPISVEEGLARDLRLQVGDDLTFNIQGVQLETTVTSIRKVDWKRFQLNFFIVFPQGVLEDAPQSFAATAKLDSAERLAAFQQELLSKASNVSTIDLTLVIAVVDELLGKFETVLQVLGWITVAIGLSVLGSAIIMDQVGQRDENNLLRLLGMTVAELQISRFIQQVAMGLLTVTLGVGLGLLVAIGVSRFYLEMRLTISPAAILLPTLLCFALVVTVGTLITRMVAEPLRR